MPRIMKRRDPLAKDSVDIQAKAAKRVKALNDAGKIHGKTSQEIKSDEAADAPWEDVAEPESKDDDSSWLEQLWRHARGGE